MRKHTYSLALCTIAAITLFFSGCSSNSSGSNPSPQPSLGTVSLILNDAPTDDWATIGVKVLGISLVPQGGGSPVDVYTAPSPAPVINLVQLDQLGEILGNVDVPVGTYTRALLTIGANPGDVILTASDDPEPGFAGTPGATVSPDDIEIQGATGTTGNMTVSVSVTFISPLVVTANQNNALALEFDLSHPAFIIAHNTGGVGNLVWAINFKGPLRHHRIRNIRRLVLRHLYGTVTSVAADGSSLTITKLFPAVPATTPVQSFTSSSQSLQIKADNSNGTLFYDVDAKTKSNLLNFTSVSAGLVGKFVRVAARYEADGTLVGVRVWASNAFQNVWFSPEGHVLHVFPTSLVVEGEDGTPITINVDGQTQFFFREPDKPSAGHTPIGSGTSVLSNIFRGFKVHVSVVDPPATTLVADTVDIEIARFTGALSLADAAAPGGFTYTRQFGAVPTADDYTKRLAYISTTTANGNDPLSGDPITGFKYWFFAYPTQVTSGADATFSFSTIANGSVGFGGSVGPLTTYGASYALWNDPAAPSDWSAPWVVIGPSPIPLGTVFTSWTPTSTGGQFDLSVPGGSLTPRVTASSDPNSATLVYQVDRASTGRRVTISPQDLTTEAGLTNVANNLQPGTPVKVFGVPQADKSIRAYVIFYYTGTIPTS
jgi:hypothetical protein